MIMPETLKKSLCSAFCTGISVNPVPLGLAISTTFLDSSGDKISFYLIENENEFHIEDDGEYLSNLIAMGIPIETGTRGNLLDAILAKGDSYWDRDTYEIRTNPFESDLISERSISFLSSLIRVRDLELLTRDTIRSTFREDVLNSITEKFGDVAEILENEAVNKEFSEFPADIVVRPKSSDSAMSTGAIYLVNNNDKLNEALLLKMEASQEDSEEDFKVIALLEEPNMGSISRKKFQRAQNRSLSMPIFRGDEEAAMKMIHRELKLAS